MLTAVYRCTHAEWPDANVYVSTDNPGGLERYCPGAMLAGWALPRTSVNNNKNLQALPEGLAPGR